MIFLMESALPENMQIYIHPLFMGNSLVGHSYSITSDIVQREREQWTVYYTSPQRFTIMISFSLA